MATRLHLLLHAAVGCIVFGLGIGLYISMVGLLLVLVAIIDPASPSARSDASVREVMVPLLASVFLTFAVWTALRGAWTEKVHLAWSILIVPAVVAQVWMSKSTLSRSIEAWHEEEVAVPGARALR